MHAQFGTTPAPSGATYGLGGTSRFGAPRPAAAVAGETPGVSGTVTPSAAAAAAEAARLGVPVLNNGLWRLMLRKGPPAPATDPFARPPASDPFEGWLLVRVTEADDPRAAPNVQANSWLTTLREFASAADITASYVDPLKTAFPLLRELGPVVRQVTTRKASWVVRSDVWSDVLAPDLCCRCRRSCRSCRPSGGR